MANFCFKLLIAGMAPALALCGEPNHSWNALMQSLQSGKTVVVTRMGSVKLEGKLLGITAESITVQWHGQPQVVRREDVYRVRIANIRLRNTLLGMGAGAGAGAIIGGAVGGSQSYGNAAVGAGGCAVLGVGIGAAIGGVLPIGPPLYEATEPTPKAAKSSTGG